MSNDSSRSRFDYDSLSDVAADADRLGLDVPVQESVETLAEPHEIDGREVPNSMCANPIEGRDATPAGAPDELSFRRYRRLAEGGSGMVWVEATAVTEDGKTSPAQFHITESTVDEFGELVDTMVEHGRGPDGADQRPFTVLQLTHSGRHSAPDGEPAPVIAHRSEVYDEPGVDSHYVTDRELDELQERFVEAAALASEAGFDAVDVKACHGYLLHELLFSYEREDSRYGGSYENRTRFLRETVAAIREEVPDVTVTTRLNVYDRVPYPWGWGMARDGSLTPDLDEPVRLIEDLSDLGVSLVNVGMGNPYYNPDFERPADQPVEGQDLPDEHPLTSIAENLEVTAALADRVDDVLLVGTGLSWLRQFFPNVAAAARDEGWMDLIGVGRASLADPHYANRLLEHDGLPGDNVCIACSSCSQMMRDGVEAGCIVRDTEIYRPIYVEGRRQAGD
ncbi:MAG: hypothetical protein ABEJ40_12020 [Haloarculaceae archaeon]